MNTLKRVAVLASMTVLASGCAGFFGGLHRLPSGGGATQSPGTGTNPEAFTCPSSDSSSSIARLAASTGPRHRFVKYSRSTASGGALLAVTYDAKRFASNREQMTLGEQNLGASFVREYDFKNLGTVTHVVRVGSGSVAALEGALRALPGVRSVSVTGSRRHLDSVTQPFLTDDPIFQGFSATPPLYETSTTEGQWDMHVARLEYAFAYSQTGNGSSATNASAIGSQNVKIAIVDTGIDTTQPDLTRSGSAAKIGYQRCFITDPDGSQSTSDFEIDPAGHGTNVAGLAAAEPNNAFGFAGAGGNVSIDAYRVFPTPDDSCLTSSPDDQCTTNTQDVASAVEDAVAQKVNVINLSLGDSSCTTAGVDDDTLEGNAIADAIAANIVVVAAAGNDGTSTLEAPACDSGVIAAGATGLSDGTTNGAGNNSGSAANPREYLASYSDYGSPGESPGNAGAWGIVAPGGDPSGSSDEDDLHFVENIWTTTPFDSNFMASTCETDGLANSTAPDCRAFSVGTSIASPIVAGAAALVLSVNGEYQSPALMKQLLCSTADDIGVSNEGCGRVDIYRAMAVAVHDGSIPGPRPTP